MRIRRVTVLFLSLTGLLAAGWTASGQQTRRIDDLALRNSGKTGEEWLTYGLTPGETRYSPLKQIDTGNVSRLGLAWSYDVGAGGGNQEATPLFWNGSLYGITNWSVVFAVDARTGKERWRWDPEVNQTAVRPKICCGVVNRGIAIYQDKIIAPVIDGTDRSRSLDGNAPVRPPRVDVPGDRSWKLEHDGEPVGWVAVDVVDGTGTVRGAAPPPLHGTLRSLLARALRADAQVVHLVDASAGNDHA